MAEVKLIIKHKDTFELLYEQENIEIKSELHLLLNCKYLKLGGRLFRTDHEHTTYEDNQEVYNHYRYSPHKLIIYAIEILEGP